MGPLQITLIVIGLLVCLAAGFVLGYLLFNKKYSDAKTKIQNAEEEALRIYNGLISNGENRKKELLLEAKDEIHKLRTEYEREVKERRAELSKQERRLAQKEATLDKKTEAFEKRKRNWQESLPQWHRPRPRPTNW